jgi:type IX secretion system PorP/SprF family membrane protein
MMQHKKIHILIVTLLLFLPKQYLSAQHDPLVTQYMFNTLALNPAYAGTGGVLNAMISSRHQWVGFEDAPSTQTFSIHTPVVARNFGTGLSLIHDKIGPISNTNAWFDYSYQLRLTANTKLSLGLKGGFSHYQKDLTRYLQDVGTGDDAFNQPVETKLLPNFGFGLYTYSDRFYAGLSIPRLVENNLTSDTDASGTFVTQENRLYILMGGFVMPLSREFMLKPSFIVRATESAPVSFDVNLSALIWDKLWIGGFWRYNETVGGIIQYRITDQLSFGYAFDTGIKELSSHFGSSHEVMLSFEFNFRKDKVTNPRYF